MISPEYAAGLFDGEGCVFINRSWRAGYRRVGGEVSPRYLSYTLVVTVTNSCYDVLAALHERWGGIIVPKQSPLARRRVWNWQANRTAAVPFLVAISPFVRAKRDQVKIALLYIRTRQELVGRCGVLRSKWHCAKVIIWLCARPNDQIERKPWHD